MKTRGLILILAILLFSSCIVKSLQPFYTKASISYNDKLLGNWTDNKKGDWFVESIKAKFEEDKKDGVKLTEADTQAFEAYKDGYYINYIKKDNEAGFIAMPFKIDQQYFLDFIPIEIEDEEINSLAADHLLKTHSVAKLDFPPGDAVKLSWLSEEKITNLLNTKKMRLKHESIGPEETLLLSATSKELYAFLKKYISSDVEEKWKQSDMLTLVKTNAKP
jgi:hypothetical protein